MAITIAQFGVGLVFGCWQVVAGLAAVGQFAVGLWVLAQIGFGRHVWSVTRKDDEAIECFRGLAEQLGFF